MAESPFAWNETIQKMNLQKLGLTETEIADVLEKDRAIERGENPFPLSAEAEKASKKARQADRAPTVFKFQKRERKADNDKREIIKLLLSAVSPICETEPEVTNPEREFLFMYNGKKYKIVLSAPRK